MSVLDDIRDGKGLKPITSTYFTCQKGMTNIIAHPETNADRIRSMTDMELAKELSRIHGTCDWCPMHDDCDGENCDGQLLDWLKEVTE